ncbi:MAG: hypothetical protein QME32_05140 [Endomicrobiia bacterium]|nr:hypothetical protein [Endomicrobiia bacterium]
MKDEKYISKLENVIKQMLRPLKDVPFNLAIEAMTGKKVISFDFKDTGHAQVLDLLKQAASSAGKEINKTGILRSYMTLLILWCHSKFMSPGKKTILTFTNAGTTRFYR